jgi:hypothetical protein
MKARIPPTSCGFHGMTAKLAFKVPSGSLPRSRNLLIKQPLMDQFRVSISHPALRNGSS